MIINCCFVTLFCAEFIISSTATFAQLNQYFNCFLSHDRGIEIGKFISAIGAE